jgi:hypothetical protein
MLGTKWKVLRPPAVEQVGRAHRPAPLARVQINEGVEMAKDKDVEKEKGERAVRAPLSNQVLDKSGVVIKGGQRIVRAPTRGTKDAEKGGAEKYPHKK